MVGPGKWTRHLRNGSINVVFSLSVENILFLRPEQEKDKTHFLDKDVSKTFLFIMS